ncbi:MAG TPA: hypothetical protein VMY37_12890 [Thermoguttaceae bacterium]|nr:hypothetical protein [Thermoguttaceae bacterium]
MTCPDGKTWILLSMSLLDEDRAESLRQHCLECERCRSAWQEASRQHSELLDGFEAFDCNHDQRRDQLMAMLPEPVPFSERESHVALRRPWLGGITMSLRRYKTRWAAAALLPAACILFAFFLMTGEKTAFADMLEKMRQAKTMTCDFVTTVTMVEGKLPQGFRKGPQRGTHSIRFDGDTRAQLSEHEQSGRKIRSLLLGDNAYIWDGDKVRVITSAEATQDWDAEDLLSRLLEVRESPDRNLGEQMIEGRRTVGFEIAGWKLGFGTRPTKGSPTPVDSDVRTRVWVDVEQDLPIRLEYDRKIAIFEVVATMHHQWNNIKWNVPLDPADFRPPSEEELAKAETTQIPAINEAAFIDGMRAWLEWKDKAQSGIDMIKKKAQERGEELAAKHSTMFERAALDSGYPERLDMTWLMGTFGARAVVGKVGEMLSEQEPIPDGVSKEERVKLVRARAQESAKVGAQVSSEAGLKATPVAAFFMKLANEQREPEYFGATVKPGDSEAILLKWRLDDGRYRVIYGDLRAETVDSPD